MLKLDRPEWNGLSVFEESVLTLLAAAGLPVARPHGTRTVDGRSGVVLDRVDGPSLLQVVAVAGPEEIDTLAAEFVALQLRCNATHVAGLPELVPRLRRELEAGVPDAAQRAELLTMLGALDDGGEGVCHFDFHPSNVLVGPDGWVVIDWLTVATGPSAADLARTLVLWGRRSSGPVGPFPARRAARGPRPARRGRRRARRLGPHCGSGPRHRRLRRRREGLAAAGGGRVRAAVRLSRPAVLRRRAQAAVLKPPVLRRRGSPGRRRRAAGATRAPWHGSRARPGRRHRAA